MSSWVVPSPRFSAYVAGMIINRVYILLTLLLAACSTSTSVEVGSTALLTTNPAAGTAGVDVKAQIEVRFDSPIAPGAGHPIALQVGDCPGPVVAGTWSRTADGMGLRFTSTQPPRSVHSVHHPRGWWPDRCRRGHHQPRPQRPRTRWNVGDARHGYGHDRHGHGPVTQRAGLALPERDVRARLCFQHGTVAEADGAPFPLDGLS